MGGSSSMARLLANRYKQTIGGTARKLEGFVECPALLPRALVGVTLDEVFRPRRVLVMPPRLRQLVPAAWWLRFRQLAFLPLELGDRLCGRGQPLLPPRWLRWAAGGGFTAI